MQFARKCDVTVLPLLEAVPQHLILYTSALTAQCSILLHGAAHAACYGLRPAASQAAANKLHAQCGGVLSPARALLLQVTVLRRPSLCCLHPALIISGRWRAARYEATPIARAATSSVMDVACYTRPCVPMHQEACVMITAPAI
jgi:hypothetical protein